MNGTNNDQNLSLIQIDRIFREIADNHAMINSYFEGPVSDFEATTINNYPVMWCDILPVNIEKQVSRTLQYNYRVFVLDLVEADGQKSLLEVQSDTLRILTDIVVLLEDYYDFVLDYTIAANPVVNDKPNIVSGFYVELHIEIPYTLGYCTVPEKEVSFLIDSDEADIQDSDNSFIDENSKLYR